MIKWNTTHNEFRTINAIARRASAAAGNIKLDYPFQDALMDITAVHCNGCRLNLDGLLSSDDANFNHDVFGIRRHLNRNTGKLLGFAPRWAM